MPLVKSLATLSGLYYRGLVRVISSDSLRLQVQPRNAKWTETDVHVPGPLAKYIKSCAATETSLAKTDTRYVPCGIRIESLKDHTVRVQVSGPQFNRAYGAVFVVPSESVCELIHNEMNGDNMVDTIAKAHVPASDPQMQFSPGQNVMIIMDGDGLNPGKKGYGPFNVGDIVTVMKVEKPYRSVGNILVSGPHKNDGKTVTWWLTPHHLAEA